MTLFFYTPNTTTSQCLAVAAILLAGIATIQIVRRTAAAAVPAALAVALLLEYIVIRVTLTDTGAPWLPIFEVLLPAAVGLISAVGVGVMVMRRDFSLAVLYLMITPLTLAAAATVLLRARPVLDLPKLEWLVFARQALLSAANFTNLVFVVTAVVFITVWVVRAIAARVRARRARGSGTTP